MAETAAQLDPDSALGAGKDWPCPRIELQQPGLDDAQTDAGRVLVG